MPIITGIKRKSPLDLNNNIRIGVAFPLDENNMFKGTETVMEQAKSNLINVLLTYPGERVNLPNFGVGLKKLLFEQNIDLENLKLKIQSQANTYVPNIKVKNIEINMSEDKHTIFITIIYQSTLDGSEDAIQLNFK
jgi:phage baseplate assembly protein W